MFALCLPSACAAAVRHHDEHDIVLSSTALPHDDATRPEERPALDADAAPGQEAATEQITAACSSSCGSSSSRKGNGEGQVMEAIVTESTGVDSDACTSSSTEAYASPLGGDVVEWQGPFHSQESKERPDASGPFYRLLSGSVDPLVWAAVDVAHLADSAEATPCANEVAPPVCQAGIAEMPNFSGKWVMRSFEGDFESLMAEGGTPWATRKLARAGNYGIGVVTQVIKHDGPKMCVDFQAGLSSNMQRFTVDGSEQDTISEKGDQIRVRVAWDGQCVALKGVYRKSGSPCQTTQRYMLGESMVVETLLTNGTSVKRFYRK